MKRTHVLIRTGLAAAATAGLLLAGPVFAEGSLNSGRTTGSGSSMGMESGTGMGDAGTGSVGTEHGDARTDQQLASKVREKLQKEGGGDLDRVQVDTEAGRITLKGEVEQATQRQQAERLARSVPGVSNVENEIRIASDGMGGSPGTY